MAIERTGKAAELYEEGKNLYMRDNYSGAVAKFSEVINLLPNDDGAYSFRSGAYLKIGDVEKAAADVEKAIELNPNPKGDGGRYWQIASEFEKRGNKNKAIEYYQKSVEHGDFDEGTSQKALARLGATSGNMNTGNVEFR